jgi:hypothetical protein
MTAIRSYSLGSIEGLEASVQDAHDDWRGGNYAASYQKYLAIVDGRLDIAAKARLSVTAAFGPADLIVIERLSDLARLFGHLEAADDLLEAIRLLASESGNLYLADSLLLKRIDLLLGFGKLDESRELLELMRPRIGNVDEIKFNKHGLSEWETSCNWPDTQLPERRLMFSLLYLAMGRILYGYGQYSDAAASFNRGLAHSKQFKTDISAHLEIQLALGLAAARLDKGELPAAENILLELEPKVRTAKEPWPLVRWLELSAKIDQLSGRLSQAKNALTDVYKICRHYKFYQAELGAAMNFAHLLILMNQTLRANEILQQTKEIAERMGERDQAARSVFLLDILRARMRSLVDGVPIASSVTEIHEGEEIQQPVQSIVVTDIPETDNYLARFEDRVLEFHRYLGNSDLKRAALIEKTTRAAFQYSDSILIHVRLNILKATLCYYQADLEQAEALFNASAARLRELDLIPELWQVQRFLVWCWIRLNRPEQEIRKLTEQTQELLNQMSDQMPSRDQALFLLNKWTTEEELIAGQVNQLTMLQEQLASLPFHSRWRKRLQLMSRIDALCLHLENYKRKQAQRVVKASEAVPVPKTPQSFWRRLWDHSPRRCSIEYLVLPDRVLIIRRGWLSLDFGVSAVTRVHLRQLIRRWHALNILRIGRASLDRNLLSPKSAGVRNLSQDNKKQIPIACGQVADELAEILQLPRLMKSLPKRVKALSFQPDDVLHGLPFAALRCEGRYLIERFAVCTSVDREEARPAKGLDNKHALLVHVARGNRREGLSELPGTQRETKALGDLLAGKGLPVETLGDDQATKNALLSELPNCSLFHIACHGTFVRNRADLSGLILLPADDKRELLSFVDLSKLDLTGVQHATLSSCWSADNFILPGRWIISLPEALNRAGVGSVLASFWKVNDDFAVSFMTRFFGYLDKHPRDQALRRAQLDCLNGTLVDAGPGVVTSDPFHWANYTLHGEHKKLRLRR